MNHLDRYVVSRSFLLALTLSRANPTTGVEEAGEGERRCCLPTEPGALGRPAPTLVLLFR